MSDPEPAACPVPTAPAPFPTRLELAELALLPLLVGSLWLLAGGREWTPSLGTLLAYASVVVFGQHLLRDLVLLLVRRRAGERKRLVCLCAESSLGLALLAGGLLLLFAGIEETVTVTRGRLCAGVAGLLAAGFVAKDYVLIVRRERDHASVVLGR